MLANIDKVLEYARSAHQTKEHKQHSLFSLIKDQASLPPLRLSASKPATLQEKLAWEKELMGLYVSGHPLDQFPKAGAANDRITIEKIKTIGRNSTVSLYAIIAGTRKI